jgi:SAM-dependent methyltransferase
VSVLHHVDLDACLANTLSLLRPGGRFAFSEPNIANPQVWIERNVGLVQRLRHVLPHEHAFRPRGLRERFEDHGFDVEISEPFEFLHAATPEAAIPVVTWVERQLERTPIREIAGSVRIAGSRRPA